MAGQKRTLIGWGMACALIGLASASGCSTPDPDTAQAMAPASQPATPEVGTSLGSTEEPAHDMPVNTPVASQRSAELPPPVTETVRPLAEHRRVTIAPSKATSEPAKPAVEAAPTPPPQAPSTPLSFRVASSGRASFLIDAPLEKIKGRWTRFGGELSVDPRDLRRSRGEITMDLTDLKTTTFDDGEKNATQTGHALNWMEIGSDVSREARTRNARASFKVLAIERSTPDHLELDDEKGAFHAVLKGILTLHGIESEHVVDVNVELEGGGATSQTLHIVTTKPLHVSLKRHDIKPRDLAGRFLAGALDQVGQKISDTVQVTIDVRANRL